MNNKHKQILLLVLLLILLFGLNYPFLDNKLNEFLDESETGIVERIIDGDTIVVNNNTHVRLLGINTPEKKEKYYEEAKKFLENLILNKTVKLEFGKSRYDIYNRILAYIILEGENINLEVVRNGLGNVYLLEDKMHETELRNAWKECINKSINLCEKSTNKCADCIGLKILDVKNQQTNVLTALG